MKTIAEQIFIVGGAVLIWGKIGSIVLSLFLVVYGCYRFNKLLTRINLLKQVD